jgi:hypothetical protein
MMVINKDFVELFGEKFKNIPSIIILDEDIMLINIVYAGKEFEFFGLNF